MASPVGHALVGVATASAVAGFAGAPQSGALWVGACAASILPDLDLALRAVGLRGPRFHRNATHSLLTIGALILGIAILTARTPIDLDWRLALAWSAALVTHPILDVLTTGPATSHAGYGIPLFWPFHRHRWFLRRPIFESLDFSRCRSLREVWVGLRPELYILGPFALLAVVVAFAV